MSGKLVCVWRGASIAEASRRRYLAAQEQLRTAHHEVANLFFSQFEDSDDTPSEASEQGIRAKRHVLNPPAVFDDCLKFIAHPALSIIAFASHQTN
jgi:hypothetical protein